MHAHGRNRGRKSPRRTSSDAPFYCWCRESDISFLAETETRGVHDGHALRKVTWRVGGTLSRLQRRSREISIGPMSGLARAFVSIAGFVRLLACVRRARGPCYSLSPDRASSLRCLKRLLVCRLYTSPGTPQLLTHVFHVVVFCPSYALWRVLTSLSTGPGLSLDLLKRKKHLMWMVKLLGCAHGVLSVCLFLLHIAPFALVMHASVSYLFTTWYRVVSLYSWNGTRLGCHVGDVPA